MSRKNWARNADYFCARPVAKISQVSPGGTRPLSGCCFCLASLGPHPRGARFLQKKKARQEKLAKETSLHAKVHWPSPLGAVEMWSVTTLLPAGRVHRCRYRPDSFYPCSFREKKLDIKVFFLYREVSLVLHVPFSSLSRRGWPC